jgi:hypothetical protein
LFGAVLARCLPCASAQQRDERAVRAAYVFNLTKYVQWPQETSELIIGFIGSPTTGEKLRELLEGKTSESRSIHVALFPSEEELQKCSILYLTDTPSRKLRAALDKPASRGILTVGESDLFVREGGMVGLVKVGDQIQIQVNLEAMQQAGVKISSRLLNVAVLVRPVPTARN